MPHSSSSAPQKTILLISPYWKEEHRWMVSSVKLAELWQRLGYRVIVACMGSQTKMEEIGPTLTVHSRKDFFLPDPWNTGICFGFSRFVRKLVEEEKPDHIVVNKILFWTSLSTLGLRHSGYKVILLTDALVGMTWWPRGWLPRFVARIAAWTVGWKILRGASRVVFFHPQPEKLLKRLGIAEKSRVIPTGIDPKSFDASGKHRDPKYVAVTYVGRLESVKGVDDFLGATVPLLDQYPALRIQVVGWYKEGHPLVSKYERQIVFTGLQGDVANILAATDIFVLPSYSEGLSNALMEAMASSCACIASEVGGNRFLIQNGISGFLFPAGDREALRAHVERLLKDPAKRRALGEAARKRIEEVFSWEKVGKEYQRLFGE